MHCDHFLFSYLLHFHSRDMNRMCWNLFDSWFFNNKDNFLRREFENIFHMGIGNLYRILPSATRFANNPLQWQKCAWPSTKLSFTNFNASFIMTCYFWKMNNVTFLLVETTTFQNLKWICDFFWCYMRKDSCFRQHLASRPWLYFCLNIVLPPSKIVSLTTQFIFL